MNGEDEDFCERKVGKHLSPYVFAPGEGIIGAFLLVAVIILWLVLYSECHQPSSQFPEVEAFTSLK